MGQREHREARRVILSGSLLKQTLVCLTQDEFRLCFVLQWLQEAEGYDDIAPLEQFATPGIAVEMDSETGALPFFEHFWRAIRYC